ncbi:J domain-containing protein [Halorientalis brevis]|uniref:J domain-containing protein n=1 Tax=Halorientalis brevis TaxID=1126241 RepID=A0ABD6CI29_9EURY|nr:DnaJ domain-containing protein [Halorientalis brevis]
MAETFYSVLGVDPEADTETIQAAYRELVKTHHPDVSDEDDAVSQFKRITQARDILCDESSRKQYDRVGHNTYVRRYMDGNAWTVDHTTDPGTTTSSTTSGSGETTGSDWTTDRTDATTESATGTATGNSSRSQGGTGRSQRTNESGTAHDYDRYRSNYSAEETYQSGQSRTAWQDRAWTDDFDWSPDDGTATDGPGSGGTGSHEQAQADGWQAAQAAATGYRPSGRESASANADFGASTGTVRHTLREVGPWLVFHFVFLVSAFVTILLLISWKATFMTVFISLIVLGGSVFFSVLHMISRIYS